MVCHLSPCYITFNVSYQWLEGYGFNSRLDVRNFWVSQFEELRHSHSECPNKCWPNAEADVETVKQAKNWSVKNDVVFCHFWHKVPGCEKALATSNIAGRESSRKSLCPFIDLFLSPFSSEFFFVCFFFGSAYGFQFILLLQSYSTALKVENVQRSYPAEEPVNKRLSHETLVPCSLVFVEYYLLTLPAPSVG